MKASDLRLDDLLDQHPDQGRLELRGGRALLTDASATYRLAEELRETLGEDAARGVLLRYGYQTGYREAASLRYLTWDDDLEFLQAAARTQTILGIGLLTFEEMRADRSQGVFRVTAVAQNSFEAAEHKARLGPTDACVCHRLTGYLSGFASAWLGDAVLFIEETCAARSDDSDDCRIVGRLRDEWGHTADNESRRYQRDAIGERLASRDREVLAQAVKIREQELELIAKQRIEQASRLKSEFLANISHELRTPLNSIIGYADLLLTRLGAKLPATPRQNLSRILANAEHLLGLINSILDISKIEAGRMDLHLEPVDLNELLNQCVEDAAVLIKDKPVKLVKGYQPEEVPLVLADRLRLHQCLTNVLANAAKFTDAGTIRLETRRVQGRSEGRSVPYLALAISDTGPGIPREHQATIFEPFRQVDASTTRSHGGTGLGLPIVRQLLELMKGEIQLTSSSSAGATFTLLLQVASGSPPPARASETATETAPEPPSEKEDSPGQHLLLIDDDPDFATIVRALLEDDPAGRALRVERDPIKGIAAARLEPPALVLLDLKLPNVDGREVLRLLREDERTRAIPVIVISIRDDLLETLAEGAAAALKKPVSRAAFLAQITATLSGAP